jgi:L-amino acid N-acyltransferase YncA
MDIRPASTQDAKPLVDLYNEYILKTTTTFEIAPISASEMQQRIEAKQVSHDWLVAAVNGTLVGYAYYGAFHARAAYRHTVEVSIYLHPEHRGKGHGKVLYRQLLASATEKGFREAIAIITIPNPASLALHRALGFQETGVLKNVGYKFGDYIDVGIWQKSLVPCNSMQKP